MPVRKSLVVELTTLKRSCVLVNRAAEGPLSAVASTEVGIVDAERIADEVDLDMIEAHGAA